MSEFDPKDTRHGINPDDMPPLEPTAEVPPVNSDTLNDPAYWNKKLDEKSRIPKREHRDGPRYSVGQKAVAAVGGLVLAGGALFAGSKLFGSEEAPTPKPNPTATAPVIPETPITNPNDVPSIPPTGGVETPAPTPTSSVEAPVVDPVKLLELSPAEFNGLDRNSRLVAGHWLMEEAKNHEELFVGDNDYELFESNPVKNAPTATDDGQAILDDYRFGRQLALSQKVDPKDNLIRTLDEKQASHALSVPFYYTDADSQHLDAFDEMSANISKPGEKKVEFSTQKYTLVSESELQTGEDIEGNSITYKDITYTSSTSPDKELTVRFIFTIYTVDGNEYHVWQAYLAV